MQPEFLECLPADLAQLVLETEQSIGFPIEVVVVPQRAGGLPGQTDPMACEVEKDSARMLVASNDQFRPSSVLHELLHIRRFLVDGVPKLVDDSDYMPWTPAIRTACTLHDNSFEHLVIVPLELRAFPESRDHWEAVMARGWEGLAAGEGNAVERRQFGLMAWAFLRLILPDSPTLEVARAVLESSNQLEAAEQFCTELFPLLDKKEAAIRVWLRHQQVPFEMVSFRYLDPREQRAWETAIEAVE